MSSPVTPRQAFVALVAVERWGGSHIDRIALDQRDALRAISDARDIDVVDLLREISEEGDAKDRRIARLEAVIDLLPSGDLELWISGREDADDDVRDVARLLGAEIREAD